MTRPLHDPPKHWDWWLFLGAVVACTVVVLAVVWGAS